MNPLKYHKWHERSLDRSSSSSSRSGKRERIASESRSHQISRETRPKVNKLATETLFPISPHSAASAPGVGARNESLTGAGEVSRHVSRFLRRRRTRWTRLGSGREIPSENTVRAMLHIFAAVHSKFEFQMLGSGATHEFLPFFSIGDEMLGERTSKRVFRAQ